MKNKGTNGMRVKGKVARWIGILVCLAKLCVNESKVSQKLVRT